MPVCCPTSKMIPQSLEQRPRDLFDSSRTRCSSTEVKRRLQGSGGSLFEGKTSNCAIEDV
jgi:hypothetical protein